MVMFQDILIKLGKVINYGGTFLGRFIYLDESICLSRVICLVCSVCSVITLNQRKNKYCNKV